MRSPCAWKAETQVEQRAALLELGNHWIPGAWGGGCRRAGGQVPRCSVLTGAQLGNCGMGQGLQLARLIIRICLHHCVCC